MDEKHRQPLWLAPLLALLSGPVGMVLERLVMGRWSYSGLWFGACMAVAFLIAGLITRR